MIRQYFKCIDNKDLSGILELFDYDAVVQEPFSNIAGGLKGKSSIEPFLKVAMMANSNFQRTIKFEKSTKPNKIAALVTFERGDKVKGRFTFEFEDEPAGGKKIKLLHIEFL
ncbi:MAG: nuclear transport factor 2 family protein [Thermoproteota archaeon]